MKCSVAGVGADGDASGEDDDNHKRGCGAACRALGRRRATGVWRGIPVSVGIGPVQRGRTVHRAGCS